MTSPRHLRLSALGCVALAGCGSNTDTATTVSAAPAATTQAAAAPAAPVAAAKTAAVTIKDFEYRPAEVTVAESGTVRFENADAANHTEPQSGGRDRRSSSPTLADGKPRRSARSQQSRSTTSPQPSCSARSHCRIRGRC